MRALPWTATLRLNGLWERVLREPRSVRFLSGDWADLGPLLDGPGAERREAGSEGGFDLILSAETIYSTEVTLTRTRTRTLTLILTLTPALTLTLTLTLTPTLTLTLGDAAAVAAHPATGAAAYRTLLTTYRSLLTAYY